MSQSRQYSIAVVSLDQVQQATLRDLLVEEGHSVDTFPDAENALAAIGTTLPDLIITGLSVPGLEGWALCRLLRSPEYPICSQVPILIVSATLAGDEARRITMELGGNGLLGFPVEKERFLDAVGALLRGDDKSAAGVAVRQLSASEEQCRRAAEDADAVHGTLQNISERIQAEHKMSSLVTAIEQAGEQIVITGLDGTIQYCNPAFERVTGYSKDEAIGQNPRILKSGKQSTEFYERLWGTIKSGSVWSGQFTNRKKDGSLYYEDATISPIHDSSGKMTGFVAVKRDLTERVNLENQLWQAQKLESVGRLAGGVAHDFNNLLTVINGYGNLLMHQLEEGDPLRDSVAEICDAGERAVGLTKQLLAFSRGQVLEPRPVDLNGLVLENRALFQRLVGENIELVTQLAPELGQVMADPGQLHHVLMNLVVNARDAMPAGGRLTIETANADLDENYAAGLPDILPGPFVLLSISDTGIGISEENRQRIFDPFFTTKGEGKGPGLGLSTVYGIVRQGGGSISVHSEPGRGAKFTIYLPRIEASVAASAGPVIPAGTLRGSETILLVEDQEEVRRLVVTVLKNSGYRMLETANGSEALLLAERHPGPIHLMLTDVVMPRTTGKELAERLQPLRPEMKVLYMSGYAADVVARPSVLDSSEAYIAKPFSPDALAAKVREVLGPARSAATILVVDDEDSVRRLFRRVLVGAGYEVLVANDGSEAMAMVQEHRFDVVLTDLVMPEREGIETIQILREEQPNLKIIAVSGAFGGTFLKVAEALGANATLLKPVSPDQLLTTVRRMLG